MENSYVLQLLDPKFKEFYLCFCGYAECEPLHSFGPAVRPNYILHYILDGKGIYQVNNHRYELSKGQGFLIEPEVSTFYQADKQEPWTYLWIGFSGSRTRKFLYDTGLGNDVLTFQCPYGDELRQIVLSMLTHTHSSSSNLFFLQGKLYEFFSVLSKDLELTAPSDITPESDYVQEAVSYIRNYYSDGIDVMDIASHLNVSRSYLHSLFKNSLEMSPKEFLTKFRISRAKEQLTLTTASVEQIARSCGYNDTLVFSKAFKREIGIPPTAYRKLDRGNARSRLTAGQTKLDEIMQPGKILVSSDKKTPDCGHFD